MKNVYLTLAALFTSRAPLNKKVANNTVLHRDTVDGAIHLKLHNTDVITAYPGGDLILRTGGFQTNTTKDRINSYLPSELSIYQAKGVWYHRDGRPFEDGAAIAFRGEEKGYQFLTVAPSDKDAKKLRRQILTYSKGFAAALPVEQPSGGDCWYCALKVNEPATPRADFHGAKVGGTIPTLGDAMGDTSHLTGHMEESYFVPSLLLSAMKEFGASEAVQAGAFIGTGAKTGFYGGIAKRDAAKYIRRFLYRRFNLPSSHA